jgi:hypothetical protein
MMGTTDRADATECTGRSAFVQLVTRMIPASDRQAIVGDLLEDAAYRDIRGARLRWWLIGECAAIAAGLSVTRVRGWLVLPPVREVVSGFAVDGRGVLRGGDAIGTTRRALIFCGSIATIALGVELLVAALMSASGL